MAGKEQMTPQALYEIRESEGKGKGLFATKDLPKGTLILLDKPLGFTNTSSQDMTLGDVQDALSTMTTKQRETFMTLSDHGGTSPHRLVRIFQTNGLGWRGGSCICLKISLVNHSCRPNAKWTSDDDRNIHFVTTTSFIPKDTEITFNYAAYTMNYTRSQRRALLKTIWSFDCTCEACSPPPGADSVQLSDMRRILIIGLHAILKGKNGKVKAENYHLALQGSNGRDMFEIKNSRIMQYTEADRTFAWFLFAKLMEAEGAFHLALANAWLQAANSLKERMMAEGQAGRRLVNPEAWFENYRSLKKAMFDVSKICMRPEGSLVFTEPGKKPWTVGKVCVQQSLCA